MLLVERRSGLDSAVWPVTAEATDDGDVRIAGVRLSETAERYGTPLHLIDETDVRQRCRDFRAAFPGGRIAYAAKAFICRAMARWITEEGLPLDVCSAGELAVARAAHFPGERILMHGNANTPEDLRAATSYGVGRIVVDNVGEIARLAALTSMDSRIQRVLVRVTPGIDAHPSGHGDRG